LSLFFVAPNKGTKKSAEPQKRQGREALFLVRFAEESAGFGLGALRGRAFKS